MTRRRASALIWLAPAAILFFTGARVAAAASLIIAASLYFVDRPTPPPDLAYASALFSMPHTIRLMRQLPLSIALAAAVYLIGLVFASDQFLTAILLLIATFAVFVRTKAWSHRPPNIGAVTTVVALLLTISALRLFSFGGGGSSRTGAAAAQGQQTTNLPPNDPANATGLAGWTGVILIPNVEPEKHVILVPPLPSMSKDIFKKTDDNPLTIPFYGVYWFYRFPATRPPPGSPTLRGSPEDIRFRSQGRVPLSMEAHQNLGKLIDVTCCARIKVAIHNAEGEQSRLESSRVQLVLANTADPGQRPSALAMQTIDGSEHQVLDFPMRPYATLRQFDELNVRIFRGMILSKQSARISVERFVLVPKGR